jgi:hypothetical protein
MGMVVVVAEWVVVGSEWVVVLWREVVGGLW